MSQEMRDFCNTNYGPGDEPGEDDAPPVAWAYELANYTRPDGTYTGWCPRLDWHEPNVPEGSLRNLVPLYATKPTEIESLRVKLNEARRALYAIKDNLKNPNWRKPEMVQEAERGLSRSIPPRIPAPVGGAPK